MQEKKKQYILDDLLRIILAMFVLTVLFAFSCLLLSHGARGIWLAVLAQVTLLGVLGGVFLRRCLRIVQKNEQVMQLYAAGYTIADICHLKCYFSRGTEMALKKAVALLDTGKLLSVSKRQAQYLALQNQINPHFFFNSLNGISSLIRKKNDENTLLYVTKLSDIFRYILQSDKKNLVPLSEELAFIEAFQHVMVVRFANKLTFTIEVPEDKRNLRIPVLSLLPLVENVTVHNIIDSEHRMDILIRLNERMELVVSNPIYPKLTLPDTNGTGLKNLENRFLLLMNKQIRVESDEDEFQVYLPLK
mgnify:CR=1 FL=1